MIDGVPEFKRRVGESERAFMQRVDRETQAVIEQSKFDDKFHRVRIHCFTAFMLLIW